MASYTGPKEGYLKCLRRIEGQVWGIPRIVEEGVYCINILAQTSAAIKVLQAVNSGLLEDHMNHHVLHATQAGDEEGTVKTHKASNAATQLVRS